jgi:hypothetical protein
MRTAFLALTLAASLQTVAQSAYGQDGSANEIFVRAVQDYQSLPAGVPERLAALSAVREALDVIVNEHPSSDIAVRIMLGEPLGPIDLQALDREISDLEAILSAEACAIFTTVNCLLDMMAIAGFEPPQPGGSPLETLDGVLRNVMAAPSDYHDRQSFDAIAPYAALIGLLAGEEDRAIAYLQIEYDDVPSEEVIGIAILENMEVLTPNRNAQSVADVISRHIRSIEEPDTAAIALAAELFSENPIMERLEELDQAVAEERFRAYPPEWITNSLVMALVSDEERTEILAAGLEEWSHEILSRDQMIEVAILALESGRELVREEQLWYAALHGFLDEVIETAERLGQLPRGLGYFSATQGAMQLGYDGNQEGFDRILAVVPNQPDYVLVNFAFGQVLAGAGAEVLSELGATQAVIDLALALQGRTPEEVRTFFRFDIDPRLEGVEANDITAARIFNLDMGSEIPNRRDLEGLERTFRDAYVRQLASGDIDLGRARDILEGLRDDRLAMYLATSVEDPSQAMALIDQLGPTAQAYRTMLIHPGVLANSAEEYLASE